MLKLPTHVPPDGKQSHDSYSEAIGGGLQRIKSKLSKNEDDESGHKITDETAPDCRTALENLSKELRKMLIKAGEKNPGVNIDNLNLDSINWNNV